jgi:hypothetical protein
MSLIQFAGCGVRETSKYRAAIRRPPSYSARIQTHPARDQPAGPGAGRGGPGWDGWQPAAGRVAVPEIRHDTSFVA